VLANKQFKEIMMTSMTSSSELICHPHFDLLIEIAEGITQLELELDIPLYWLMLLVASDDDNLWDLELPGDPAQDNRDGTIADDDAEKKRLKEWTAWRKKIRIELVKQLKIRGFDKNQIKKVLKDLKGLGKKPTWGRLFKFFAKWMWALKKVLDAYKAAKKKVGPAPEGPPPPPEEISMESVMWPCPPIVETEETK
jgi:hypothetical protein